jgi:hypothetical protein
VIGTQPRGGGVTVATAEVGVVTATLMEGAYLAGGGEGEGEGELRGARARGRAVRLQRG